MLQAGWCTGPAWLASCSGQLPMLLLPRRLLCHHCIEVDAMIMLHPQHESTFV